MEHEPGDARELEIFQSRAEFLQDWKKNYLSYSGNREVREAQNGEDQGQVMRKPNLKLISTESSPEKQRRRESWSIEGILFLVVIVGLSLLAWFGIGYLIWRLTR